MRVTTSLFKFGISSSTTLVSAPLTIFLRFAGVLSATIAVVNDADPIAEDVCLEHRVCRENDRRSEIRVDAPDEVADLACRLWIQAERRLIQKEDFRFIEQCADDIDPLLHSR